MEFIVKCMLTWNRVELSHSFFIHFLHIMLHFLNPQNTQQVTWFDTERSVEVLSCLSSTGKEAKT